MALVYGSTATNLDFQNQRYFSNGMSTTFDNLITFSRGSLGTIVDSTGKIAYAPHNMITYSEQFDNAAWSKLAGGVASVPTVTANYATAPDGTMTADRVQLALNGGTTSSDISQIRQDFTFNSLTYMFSIWMKSNTGSNQSIILFVENSQVTTVTVTPQWQRFSATRTCTGLASSSGFRIRGAQTADTADILVWGGQLEIITGQTTPSTYIPTTSSAYYSPRFDYDPVTLQPKGLLIEESRINAFTYSEQFDNGAWTKQGGASITANQTVAPDGTTSADLLTVTSGNLGLYQVPAGANSTAYTVSVYAKAGTVSSMRFGITNQNESAACYYDFDLSAKTGGAAGLTSFTSPSYSITDVGNGWCRCVVSATSPASGTTNVGAFLRSNNIGNFSIWGIQRETGAFATSYIPTGSATVQRNADSASIAGTNFTSIFSLNEGTIVSQHDVTGLDVSKRRQVWSINDAGLNRLSLRSLDVNTTYPIAAIGTGSSVLNLGGVSYLANITQKVAVAYGTTQSITQNGSVTGTNSTPSAVTGSAFFVGQNQASSDYLNGHIVSIKYYNKRLPDAQLQALTA